MSRINYGCQLWSPYLIKHINMVEKVQRSFRRFISGMEGLSLLVLLTWVCSAASNWKPGPHAVSTIVKCLQSPGYC